MNLDERRHALSSDDAEVRRRAVVGLRGTEGDGVGDLVMRALGDDDWRVRKEAVHVASAAAEAMGIVDPLVRAICQGDNVGLRNAALDVLETLGQRAAPQLMQALPHVPEHARKFVVEALGESGGDAVVAELREAAFSEDANVAGEALEALARIGGPAAEEVMRRRLSAPDPFLRMAALDGLNRLSAVVPLAELRPLLGDRLVRRVALAAIGRSGEPEATTHLLEALADTGASARGAAALGLVQLMGTGYERRVDVVRALQQAPEKALAALRDLLARGSDIAALRAAAQLLTVARDPASVGATMRLAVRDALSPATLEAFREWGQGAIEPLLDTAEELEDPVGQAFAMELAADLAALAGEMQGPRADRVRATLRQALERGEPRSAHAAALCMAGWALAGDGPLLVDRASSPDEQVARAVASALVELARREPVAVEEAIAEVDFSRHGAALVPAILALGGPHVLDRLQAAVTADDPGTRRAATEALGELGGERAAELLALALADENRDVQAEAASALGRVSDRDGKPAAARALLTALSSEVPQVRASAARALGESGGAPGAAEALAELIDDQDVGVAVAAVEALGKLSPDEFESHLLGALHHSDSEVVKQALPALATLASEKAQAALVGALAHRAWDVRRLAAELVCQVRPEGARAALTRQLALETDDLARASLRAALDATGGGA